MRRHCQVATGANSLYNHYPSSHSRRSVSNCLYCKWSSSHLRVFFSLCSHSPSQYASYFMSRTLNNCRYDRFNYDNSSLLPPLVILTQLLGSTTKVTESPWPGHNYFFVCFFSKLPILYAFQHNTTLSRC